MDKSQVIQNKRGFWGFADTNKIIIHKTVYLHDTTNNNDNNINNNNIIIVTLFIIIGMLDRLPVEAIPDSSRAPVSAINYGAKTREKETSDIHNMYIMYIMF